MLCTSESTNSGVYFVGFVIIEWLYLSIPILVSSIHTMEYDKHTLCSSLLGKEG